MRALAQFQEVKVAETLSGVLLHAGIENRVDPTRDGMHTVWVVDELRLMEAKGILKEFEAAPRDPKFARLASAARASARPKARESSPPGLGRRTSSAPGRGGAKRAGASVPSTGLPSAWAWLQLPVTAGLIFVCIAVYGAIEIADLTVISDALWYAKSPRLAMALGLSVPDAVQGEWWRVVTPIFMHAPPGRGGTGILHIIFNLWWLKDLGPVVERTHGALHLLAFVLVSAAISNTAQYVSYGPHFLGMSGVVYGLLGLLWMRARVDPTVPYQVPPGVMMWMMIWFVLCWLGMMGPVANMAHAGGLLTGLAWGFITGKIASR
jgi:GlpG protein